MIEITRLAKAGGALTKRISLDATGKPLSDGSACTMARGSAQRVRFDGLAAFADLIGGLAPHEAIALGTLRPDLSDRVEITTKGALNGAGRPDLIARTAAYIAYRSGEAALALLDFDRKGMPPEVVAALASAGGFWAALVSMVPELATAAYVSRASTSAGLYRTDSSEALPGSGGEHIYLVIKDGADCGRFLKALHERCWLAGLGWMMVGVGGQLLERSIVDRMVGAPERLVFEGAPVLDPPLAQYQRPAVATEGEHVDTVAACPPLTIVETARFDAAVGAASHLLAPLVARARDSFVKDHAATLAARTGMDPRLAERVIERQCAGVLLPDVALPFDDPSLAGRTVSDVLADPARFDGETLADPIEGVSYGTCKAKIMRQPDGKPWIHSFAHGRTTYALRYDFRSAKAAIEKLCNDNCDVRLATISLAGFW